VTLPKSIVQALGLSVGSKLEVTLEDNKIILTLFQDTSLGDLLIKSRIGTQIP